MNRGSLKDYYSGIGFKRLRATEVDPGTSHGHEFQGVGAFRDLFGTEKQEILANVLYLSDDEMEQGVPAQTGTLSWYDSRRDKPKRSAEYRLYYPAEITIVQERAQSGDLIVVGRKPDSSVDILIAEAGSTAERQLLWLFAVNESDVNEIFSARNLPDHGTLDFARQRILEGIGIDVDVRDENYLDEMLARFGEGFPDTRTFSAYAREKSAAESSLNDPDAVLLEWLDREEILFRTMEKHLVAQRLREGFVDDVDSFIGYSLSVHNRRKSRAGQAVENHLECVFQEHGVGYSRGKVTENRSRPDFVFPGIVQYHDADFSDERLVMLGVKTTCKDRWRQVLSEAKRIRNKHLFTLEPAISVNQTLEMQVNRLQLVVPSDVHSAYTETQQEWLMSLGDFIGLVKLGVIFLTGENRTS